MTISKRHLLQRAGALAGGLSLSAFSRAFAAAQADDWAVPVEVQKAMFDRATALVKQKIRGGPNDPVYKKPFLDAAFSGSIFLWDSCFIATYAKYDQKNLPITAALDNFYAMQDSDGFICREYTAEGRPFWQKDHPVSINPPLLGFAELELYSKSGDKERLRQVYPALKAFHNFIVGRYMEGDDLFISDGLASGMDNIPRYPDGWQDDGQGIKMINLHPEIFVYDGLSPKWNRQGRSVDMSAQMALFTDNLRTIARLIGEKTDVPRYEDLFGRIASAINRLCWNEEDGFYYDLGYGKQIRRRHIGMFWVLLAGVVPKARLAPMLGHLTDPKQFWRRFPVASTPADDPNFAPNGGYWLGSVWAPTNYMIIRGLERYGQHKLARKLARQYYWCVAQVFKATGTFWENYAPDALVPGSPAHSDFCGWTALVPIAIYHEYIQVV